MKRVVLAGGGHAQIEVLRRFGVSPPPDAELVLVSPGRFTPYSGMLPGLVAGFYAESACTIDLAKLAAFAKARFIQTRVTRVDAGRRRVVLEDDGSLEYDLLSLDIGATPAAGDVAGARVHAIGVKPVGRFLSVWRELIAQAERGTLARIAVVGGGAAGIEMLLAMQQRLRAELGRDAVTFHLVTDVPHLLPGHSTPVRAIFARVLAERGVQVYLGARVLRVEPGRLHAANGLALDADAIVWAIGAGAPAQAGGWDIALDRDGFVAIGETLQSTSHPEVFAAGDVASMVGHPRPKSGVYAVRQGPPLAQNLRAALAGRPLTRHVPQARALALITAGHRYAIASRGDWALEGKWVWRWKDWIDRRFIARYRMA